MKGGDRKGVDLETTPKWNMSLVGKLWDIITKLDIWHWNEDKQLKNKININRRHGNAVLEINGLNQAVITVKKGKMVATILSDVHSPYFYPPALDLAIKISQYVNPNIIVLNGDFIDFFSISRFRSTGRPRNLKAELDATKEIIQILLKEFPNTIFLYLEGNHEFFLQRYIYKNAMMLSQIEDLELSNLLKLNRSRCIFLPRIEEYGTYGRDTAPAVKFYNSSGQLAVTIVHGDCLPVRANAVNHARIISSYMSGNIICGHWHRFSYWETYDIDGYPNKYVVLPALTYPKPHWASRGWELGMGVLTVHHTGEIEVEVVKFNPDKHENKLVGSFGTKTFKSDILPQERNQP